MDAKAWIQGAGLVLLGIGLAAAAIWVFWRAVGVGPFVQEMLKFLPA